MANKRTHGDAREFLTKLAHDLRTPLAAIRNSVLILQAQGRDGANAQWALDMIDRQTREMARMLDDVARAAPTAPPPAAAAGGARRILIVDDNRIAAMSLSLLLRQNGHELFTAHDGEEALSAASVFKPDVVVLDIGLPKIDGYAVARKLRQLPHGKTALLIALTGWGQQEDKARARESGFDHHLVKPVDAAVLEQLMASSAPARESSM